jgi:serine/threonine protein kinase
MLEPGLVIAGDFEVLERISEGGMGQVYRVRQRSTQLESALKVMHPRWQERVAFRERFEREARLSALIESAHVVQVLGYGSEPDGGAPWIAMEYLRGRTLEQYLQKEGCRPTASMQPRAAAPAISRCGGGPSRANRAPRSQAIECVHRRFLRR